MQARSVNKTGKHGQFVAFRRNKGLSAPNDCPICPMHQLIYISKHCLTQDLYITKCTDVLYIYRHKPDSLRLCSHINPKIIWI